jgi:hypothetical protein
MRRPRRTWIVAALILPLIASDVAWAFALGALADDSHHVALRSSAGRLDIVLEHDVGGASGHEHHHGDEELDRSITSLHADDAPPDGHHPDHVIRLARSDSWLASAGRHPLPTIAAANAVVVTAHPRLAATTRAYVVGGCGPDPSPPPRSSILRI